MIRPFCTFHNGVLRAKLSAMKTWRDRAREHMKATGITQDKVAEHLGMTPAGVQKWLAGTRHPTLEGIEQIADFLRVPRAWLTHGLTADDQLTGLPEPALQVLRRLVHAERSGIAPSTLWAAIASVADMAIGNQTVVKAVDTDPGNLPPQVLPDAQAIIEERVREAQQRREQSQQSSRPAKRRAS